MTDTLVFSTPRVANDRVQERNFASLPSGEASIGAQLPTAPLSLSHVGALAQRDPATAFGASCAAKAVTVVSAGWQQVLAFIPFVIVFQARPAGSGATERSAPRARSAHRFPCLFARQGILSLNISSKYVSPFALFVTILLVGHIGTTRVIMTPSRAC